MAEPPNIPGAAAPNPNEAAAADAAHPPVAIGPTVHAAAAAPVLAGV